MFRALTIISVVAAVLVAIRAGRLLAGTSPADVKMGRYPLLEALIAFVMWMCLVVQVGTGFLGATMLGHSLRGFTLLLHTGCGALFAVSLAALAVFRAEPYGVSGPDSSGRFSLVQKACFWIIDLCGLGLILSMLASMFPILGTHGQHLMIKVHKLSALIALLATILYSGAAANRD